MNIDLLFSNYPLELLNVNCFIYPLHYRQSESGLSHLKTPQIGVQYNLSLEHIRCDIKI